MAMCPYGEEEWYSSVEGWGWYSILSDDQARHIYSGPDSDTAIELDAYERKRRGE